MKTRETSHRWEQGRERWQNVFMAKQLSVPLHRQVNCRRSSPTSPLGSKRSLKIVPLDSGETWMSLGRQSYEIGATAGWETGHLALIRGCSAGRSAGVVFGPGLLFLRRLLEGGAHGCHRNGWRRGEPCCCPRGRLTRFDYRRKQK